MCASLQMLAMHHVKSLGISQLPCKAGSKRVETPQTLITRPQTFINTSAEFSACRRTPILAGEWLVWCTLQKTAWFPCLSIFLICVFRACLFCVSLWAEIQWVWGQPVLRRAELSPLPFLGPEQGHWRDGDCEGQLLPQTMSICCL